MKTAKSFILGLDLFSIPFKFSLGDNEKGKKTFIGGVLSLLIGIASLCQFAYLCYLYWSNKIAPSPSIIEQYSTDQFNLNVSPETYAIKVILSDGINLIDIQNQTNKIMLHIFGMYSSVDDDGKIVNEQQIATPCISEELKEYYCINYQNYPNGTKLIYRQANNSQLSIVFAKCMPNLLTNTQTCETNQSIITQLLVNLRTNVSMKFVLKQYDANIKEIVDKVSVENFYFDNDLSFITFISLKKRDSTINNELIFQQSETNTFISKYERNNMVISEAAMTSQLHFQAFGGIVMTLIPSYTEMQISFPQFTYLLAQFSSIFNSLLVLGLLSKIFAESEICHEMMAIQLQIYYKMTAIQLLAQKGNKIDEIAQTKLQSKGKDEKGKQVIQKRISLRNEVSPIKIIPHNYNDNNQFSISQQIDSKTLSKAVMIKKIDNRSTIPLVQNELSNVQVFGQENQNTLTEYSNEKAKDLKEDQSNFKIISQLEYAPDITQKASPVNLFISLYKKLQQLNFQTFFSKKMKISLLTRYAFEFQLDTDI